MDTNKDILNQLKRTDKPTAPENFFTDFSSNISSKIDDESFLESLAKTNQPKVPNQFFENFSNKIVKQIDEPKKGKLIRLKHVVISVLSVAAMLVLVFLATQQSQTNLVTNEFIPSNSEEYLAFVDMDEIELIDFMIENNINYDEEINEEVLFELDSELDDYYYEL